jgi:tetratricopeptide (TPR) repeat protein
MFGKFLKCFLLFVSIFCFLQNGFSKEKRNFTVNGYSFLYADNLHVRGLRLKAKADMLFRKGAYALAIQPYEDASRYLPNEADIYFNLGNIYMRQGIWQMALRYFQIAESKYLLPENHGKTQKYRYISIMNQGRCHLALDDAQAARRAAIRLRAERRAIVNNFPELENEMEDFLTEIYGEGATVIEF